jgi:hypothetical protein
MALPLTWQKAIVRYLAEKHGLRGATPAEISTCDMVPFHAPMQSAHNPQG